MLLSPGKTLVFVFITLITSSVCKLNGLFLMIIANKQ